MSTELEMLKSECANCEKCGLSKSRINVVFGTGVPSSKVMLIGEAPGENEDKEGEPFVGAAGKLLDRLLEEAGFSRKKNVYIANILKCRPPYNRDPEDAEIKSCETYLHKQIELISPKVIVLVGRISAIHFLGEDFRMTRQHGNGYYKDGVIYFPVFHPAAILRNMNLLPEAKKDFRALRTIIDELGKRN